MKTRSLSLFIFILLVPAQCLGAFSADDVLVISNSAIEDSIYLGRYYAKKRNIPEESIVELDMPKNEIISREEFNSKILLPLKDEFRKRPELFAKRVYVLMYGTPLSIANSETLENEKDTGASVDSELGIFWLLPGKAPLSGRLPNPLYKDNSSSQTQTFPLPIVGRLDGLNAGMVRRMVDATIAVEENQTLGGNFLIDARGIPWEQRDQFGEWDRDLTSLARSAPVGKRFTVEYDGSPELAGKTENIALYAGWYQLRNYQDSYTFTKGAVGYHIASAEAISVRDPEEKGWCKNLLERGVVATIGAVDEPYLDSFPKSSDFFNLLLSGKYQLGEVYYLTTRFISWRLILFGDPLYQPVSKKMAIEELGYSKSAMKKLPPPPSETLLSPLELMKKLANK